MDFFWVMDRMIVIYVIYMVMDVIFVIYIVINVIYMVMDVIYMWYLMFIVMECKKTKTNTFLGRFAERLGLVTRQNWGKIQDFWALPSAKNQALSKDFSKKNIFFAKCPAGDTRQRFFKKNSFFAECPTGGIQQRFF